MRKFIITVALIVGSVAWLRNWASTGEMDNFLRKNPDPAWTPRVLYALSETYYIAQDPKTAAHYYRWIVDDYPQHPSIARLRWQLGKSYDESGRRDLAIEQYIILKDSFTATEYGMLAANRYQNYRY